MIEMTQTFRSQKVHLYPVLDIFLSQTFKTRSHKHKKGSHRMIGNGF